MTARSAVTRWKARETEVPAGLSPSVNKVRTCVRSLVIALFSLWLVGCSKPYRVGDYVWVEWEEGAYYPAYIKQKKSNTRYRVHFEGYASRWDEDVTLDRIRGRIEGPATPPPPPKKVQLVTGTGPQKSKDGTPAAASAQPVSRYQEGDRVRVRWRGSIYKATVIGVVKSDEILVHYDGHESAWDEVVSVDRIVTKH